MNNANLPAMPVPLAGGETFSGHGFADGLSKREHFAAMAMQGIASSGHVYGHEARIAESAVAMADALLAALVSPGGES